MSRISTALKLLKLSAAYHPTAGLPSPKPAPSPSRVAGSPVKGPTSVLRGAGTVFRP